MVIAKSAPSIISSELSAQWSVRMILIQYSGIISVKELFIEKAVLLEQNKCSNYSINSFKQI
ncbi:MAG TPA: hypothetical protein VN414_12025 [Methanosarcina sp.]|nr:hypothetical protein [Methanosarcina sp.]